MNICGTGVLCQRCKAVSRCKVIFATVTRKSVVCQEELIWKTVRNKIHLVVRLWESHLLKWIDLIWLMVSNIFLFSITYGIILPIDKYFSRWLKPPTSYSFMTVHAMLMHVFGTTTCWIELVNPDRVCQGRRYNMKRIRNMRRTQTSSNVPSPGAQWC